MFSHIEAEATALKSGLAFFWVFFFFYEFGRMEKEGRGQVFHCCSWRRAGWGEVSGTKIEKLRLFMKHDS